MMCRLLGDGDGDGGVDRGNGGEGSDGDGETELEWFRAGGDDTRFLAGGGETKVERFWTGDGLGED